MTAEAVKTKEYEVRLHRTYRRGDFPDIQIPHSAIIATLQAVAQLDGTSAGLLFEAILCGLSERISCDKQRGDSVNFFRAVSARIADIFSSMSNYYRPFVSCVINYLYRFHDFVTFSPQHIAHAALMSGQPDCGIPLLERCVENSDILAPLLKRQKKSFRDSDSREFLESVWICLGRLYKASGGLENLRTIFEEHLKASERTRLALKLEYVGDYEKAISVYTDAMSEIDDSNQNSLYLAETELWEESRLECLNELSDWKHMAFLLPFYGEAGQPQYDEIWKDDYSIDFHLPFLLRSNIKLLMSASDTFREEFTSFIKRSEADEANRKILLDRHAGFLALLNILQRDCVKAKYLTHAAFDTMLMSYPTLRVTDLQARRKVLQNMHVLAEMLGYVELATSGNVTATQISALCSLWENSSTDLRAYATLTVDDLVCNRNLFIDLLVEMAGCKLTVAEEIHPSLAHFKMHYRFQYVKNALHRKNYAAALRQLEEARKISTEDDLLLLELENYEAYSICQIVKNDVVCSEKKMQLFQRAVDLFSAFAVEVGYLSRLRFLIL
ncbi:hypothetical protein D918_09762 [Trichuris suis]|nr:hypothetical protein D918_09762 [Trichuris suis]